MLLPPFDGTRNSCASRRVFNPYAGQLTRLAHHKSASFQLAIANSLLAGGTFLSLSVALPLCATGSFASMDCAGNARLHTKIDFLDLFVALKIGRLALDGDATGLQNVSIVGDAERKRDRLLGEQ